MSHHVDGGWRCLVAHYNDAPGGNEREIGPACMKCERCRKWIRPHLWEKVPCVPLDNENEQ